MTSVTPLVQAARSPIENLAPDVANLDGGFEARVAAGELAAPVGDA